MASALTTATAKGSNRFPSSRLQGNSSPTTAAQTSLYTWYPLTIASTENDAIFFDKFSIIDSEVLLWSRFNQCFAHARVRNLKLRNFFLNSLYENLHRRKFPAIRYLPATRRGDTHNIGSVCREFGDNSLHSKSRALNCLP